jgi:hypothetical protein
MDRFPNAFRRGLYASPRASGIAARPQYTFLLVAEDVTVFHTSGQARYGRWNDFPAFAMKSPEFPVLFQADSFLCISNGG